MTPVLVTQRVDVNAAYGERRDALDQQWSHLLHAAGLLPILAPNHPLVALALLERSDAKGLLLTGGNDLVAYGGDAPERDETEAALLAACTSRGRPVLGVCRGMQVLQHHFGVTLERVDGHVTAAQTVMAHGRAIHVNSYHRWGARESAPELPVWGRADDGVVKAVRHVAAPLTGIMWHPERLAPFRPDDLALLRAVFGT